MSKEVVRSPRVSPKHRNYYASIDYNTHTENIESWPASSTTSQTPTLTTNKSVAFLKSHHDPNYVMKNLMRTAKNGSSKPLLLTQLQQFIHSELNRRENKSNNAVSSDTLNESYLDVFRECFDVFISEFPTYQPVLLQIKAAYDDFIATCMKKIHHVHLIESKLSAVEKDCNEKLNRLRQSHGYDLEREKQETEKVRTCLHDTKQRFENADQLLLEYEERQKELQQQLKDAQRSSKTFYQEIKKLQIVHQSTDKEKENLERELRGLRDEHKQLTASYASVVNDIKRLQDELDQNAYTETQKLEIEEREKKLRHYQERTSEYKQNYDSLMAEYNALLAKHEKLTKDVMNSHEHSNKDRPSTPRPHWHKTTDLKCMQSLQDMDKKSSDELVAMLVSTVERLEQKIEIFQSVISDDQMLDLNIKDEDSMYTEVDYDESTPKYLRFRGRIRKRRMPKRDLEKLLADIWKRKYSSKKTEKLALKDYLYDYFKCEYGIQSRVVETAYSMLAALERYRYDADCELFLTIMNGGLSEDVYRDQNMFLQQMRNELKAVDIKKNHSKCTGLLDKAEIEQTMRKLCPAKEEPNMKKLLNALDLNDPRDSVRYELLFKEDRDGNQGPWLEELRDQHLAEILGFMQEMKDTLKQHCNQYQQLTVQQIERVTKEIDPYKPQAVINQYLCVGFGVSLVESLSKDLLIHIDTLTQRFSTILMKRTGKTPDKQKQQQPPRLSMIVHQMTKKMTTASTAT